MKSFHYIVRHILATLIVGVASYGLIALIVGSLDWDTWNIFATCAWITLTYFIKNPTGIYDLTEEEEEEEIEEETNN